MIVCRYIIDLLCLKIGNYFFYYDYLLIENDDVMISISLEQLVVVGFFVYLSLYLNNYIDPF